MDGWLEASIGFSGFEPIAHPKTGTQGGTL